MEIIEENGQDLIKVTYESPFKKEGVKEWVFKELTCAEFMTIDITEQLMEGKTKVGQTIAPLIYIINSMMVRGDKITDNTPARIYAYLNQELSDFLA